MKIGLAYDLKGEVPLGEGQPDDALEEYDSLETVDGLAMAIEARGHSVVKLGGGKAFLVNILKERVDLVFNVAEGWGSYRSREAQVPSVLEMLGIPYSGSDPQCLTVCLDKSLTKKLVSLTGVCTPRWEVVRSLGDLQEICWDSFPFPAFVKPACEGSSKGIRAGSRVENRERMADVVGGLLDVYRESVMVEEFIAGDEVTVGIVGNSPPRVLGIMRVLPKGCAGNFVYSLEVKRDWENLVEYECPAQLEPGVLRRIVESSLKAFEALGCRDFARLDFRVNAEGIPYFLEINPLAGLNPRSSDLPIMARKLGLSYGDLVAAILDSAVERYPACAPG
ncbi:MAG: D-alanine--D-alanine ligase [Chloroflexota bacterium]